MGSLLPGWEHESVKENRGVFASRGVSLGVLIVVTAPGPRPRRNRASFVSLRAPSIKLHLCRKVC